MKYTVVILIAAISVFKQVNQNAFICKNARISLYSSAPIEDIKATTSNGVSVFNANTGELAFSVAINSFRFEKSLMQEHFNSDYMESDKYPRATFKGKINEQVDITKDGTYAITVTGDLDIHHIIQTRTIKGTLTTKNGTLNMTAEFIVKCADHHIEIPRIVFHNIAESIQMNVSATYAVNN